MCRDWAMATNTCNALVTVAAAIKEINHAIIQKSEAITRWSSAAEHPWVLIKTIYYHLYWVIWSEWRVKWKYALTFIIMIMISIRCGFLTFRIIYELIIIRFTVSAATLSLAIFSHWCMQFFGLIKIGLASVYMCVTINWRSELRLLTCQIHTRNSF